MAVVRLFLDDKPNLKKALMGSGKESAQEVVETFAELMEEAFDPEKGITWAELPKLLHKDLTFRDLIKGVLRGALDLKEMDPDAFEVLKEEVHPLSVLTPRKNYIEGGIRYVDWRRYFQVETAKIDHNMVAEVIRKYLRYGRFVSIQKLKEALETNQIMAHRGLGDEQVKLLPFYPALRYQRNMYGDLHVGKFFDSVGFFDCGDWLIEQEEEEEHCPACSRPDIHIVGVYKVCLACNAGFKRKDL